MDDYLYDEALESGRPQASKMLDKEVLYVQDQNGGSYNGQIQIDTSTLANSGRWTAYSEAYLEIPLQLTYKSSVDSTAAAVVNGFILGLKNGYHQIIDSIQVDYNNTNVVQLQPFTNFFVSYKLMTSFSQDDVKKHGSSIGFCPDSAGSFNWYAGASAVGNGTSNNLVNPVAATPGWRLGGDGYLDSYNAGLLQRLKQTAYPLTTNDTGYGTNPEINTVALANQIGKNYVMDSGAAAAKVWQWNIIATIRLKDLCDFFDKMPLVRGAFLRFTINYNSCSQTITQVLNTSMVVASTTMKSGRTNPMMVAAAAATNPSYTLLTGTNTISCGISTSTTNSIGSSQISNCRLYVPAYELDPVLESQLLTVQPRRDITYTDIYNYNVSAIGAGSSFNQILTNGIVNPKYVVVIPVLNGAAGNAATAALTPYQSCFDSCPGTSSPMAAITQFNVQVSGKNMFQQNFQYDYEAFMNELQSVNALNGGCSTGLTSGLIGAYEFDNGYRYYVCDVSRRTSSDDKVPKSVVITGTNNTSKIMDYVCFIVYERNISIDLQTSQIL
jgi:hypothetical protein